MCVCLLSFSGMCSTIPRAQSYGVALVSRIDKIIGFFCKRDL